MSDLLPDEDLPRSMREPMWRRYLRLIRPNPRADLDDELRDHIESTVDRLVRHGMTPDAARAEALRRFGDLHRVRAEVTALDATHHTHTERRASMETLWYDLRHAARGLRRSPLFTAVAAISIALGVAANTAVFSVVNAILLRPVPGTHAPRLERVYMNHHSPFEWTELAFFREHTTSLEYLVGERYGIMSFRAGSGAEAERIRSSYVTSGFFPALGVRMAVGRAFDVDETTRAGQDAVTVITHSVWQRRFGGDPNIVGRQVTIADHAFTIVGVTAPEFRSSVMMWAPEVFIPFAMAPVITGQQLSDFGGSFYTTARLRAGVPPATAATELASVMQQLARTDSARYEGRTVRLDHSNGVNAELRNSAMAGSAFLMLMVGMVLLIACANVANLMLGRAAGRRTEMGVRLAIGASRGRLIRQLLTESLLLSALGTMLGFFVAWLVIRVLPASLPPEAGIDATYFAPDASVIAFTVGICLLTTVLCGLAPALRAASPHLVGMLKGAASEDARKRRRGKLVVAQTAMCVLLLAVAAYFLRGLASARGVNPGFVAEGVVDANIDLNLLPQGTDRARVFSLLLRDAAVLPGVQSASLAAVVPLGGSNMETAILQEGAAAPASRQDRRAVYFNVVSPGYFATLRTPLVRGREFAEADRDGAPRVAVVNEAAARRLWPDGDALGKRFHWGGADGPLVTIVGIARDANYVMPGESPKTTVYIPFAQEPRGEMVLQLRTTAGVVTARQQVWSLLHTLAPSLPPPAVQSMTDDMSITLLPVRAGAVLLGAFGAIALILAAAGIYGVAAYSVASRSREIGIRAALGATRERLLGMVLYESGRRVGLGLLIGLALTIAAGVGLSKVLYGVHAADPIVILGVVGVIAVVAVVGTLVPARRASRADPVAAMRSE
jgi:putative ABC transport system permease protein